MMKAIPKMSTVLAIAVSLVVAGAAYAAERKWSLQVEPVFIEVHGHDQHVLTEHRIDLTSVPELSDKTAVGLDTESSTGFRLHVERAGNQWHLGIAVFSLLTSQKTPDRTASGSGLSGAVIFEVADQRYTSLDPSQSLFYGVLEDTSVEMWTTDLYAKRTLAQSEDSRIDLLVGLRAGDFDNDYRAIVGLQDVVGTRLDASSNYDLMLGPLVGFSGNVRRGRSHFEASLTQSVLLSTVELTSEQRRFGGPFGAFDGALEDIGVPLSHEKFRKVEDVAIPVTELRLKWTYSVNDRLALGAGVFTSAWWDVPVPPGVIPIAGGDQALHENTIVLVGLSGVVKYTF